MTSAWFIGALSSFPAALMPIQQAQANPVTTAPALSADWSTLPPLPYRDPPVPTVQMTRFVVDELRSRRCPVSRRTAAFRRTLSLDLAVLIAPSGLIRRVVPRAIDCMTVEQYAAGLVTSMARGNLSLRSAQGDAWYRATIAFRPIAR